MRKLAAVELKPAVPWIGSAIGGLGLGTLGYVLAPKKHKKLFAALGLLGGATGGYFGSKALLDKQQKAEAAAKKLSDEELLNQQDAYQEQLRQLLQQPSVRIKLADELRSSTKLNDEQIAHIINTGDTRILDRNPSGAETATTQALLEAARLYTNSNVGKSNGAADLTPYMPGWLGPTIVSRMFPTPKSIGGVYTNQGVSIIGGRLVVQPILNRIAGAIASRIPGMSKNISKSTFKAMLRGGIIPGGKKTLLSAGGGTMSRAAALTKGTDAALGRLALAYNTGKNIHDTWTGKLYEEDAADMAAKGPNMSVKQALLTSLFKNTTRTGIQTLGAYATLTGHPVIGQMLGGTVPVGHILAYGKETEKYFLNNTEARRRENDMAARMLGSHFREGGLLKGLAKMFSSGYFVGEQDREFKQVSDELNWRGDRLAAKLKQVDEQIFKRRPDLAKAYKNKTITDKQRSELMRLRREADIDANKSML